MHKVPVIIGGTGGSGTRLIAGLMQTLGVQLGSELNEALDAKAFYTLYEQHINPWLTQQDWQADVFAQQLAQAVARHRQGMAPSAPWGWKNPRSIYLLPCWQTYLPNFRFVHVVRDGMTMATSNNQNQLHKHGPQLLEPDTRAWPTNWQALLLWARVNLRAADFGERQLGAARYCRIRYEDAVQHPLATLQQLARWLELPEPTNCDTHITPLRQRDLVLPPDTPALLRDSAQQALQRFGYPAC